MAVKRSGLEDSGPPGRPGWIVLVVGGVGLAYVLWIAWLVGK